MGVYRSAQGKQIDMASMATKNEKTRAVGNMGVNARGDVLDSHNRIVKEGTSRVQTNYNKSVDNKPRVIEADGFDGIVVTPDQPELPPDLSAEELEFEEQDEHEEELVKETKTPKKK